MILLFLLEKFILMGMKKYTYEYLDDNHFIVRISILRYVYDKK